MSDQSMATLIESQSLMIKQLEAKDKRIRFLEFILEQRGRETLKRFDPKQVELMVGKVYQVFLENPGRGLSYDEVGEEFKRLWHFHSEHIPQRVRDLRKAGKVWSDDSSGVVRFYLTLAKTTVENSTEVC